MDYQEIIVECAKFLEEKKAINVVVMDLKGLSSISDYFIIASGENPRHTLALSDYAEDFLASKGYDLHHKEGIDSADWVVLDYMDFMIHLFNSNKREFYNLDELWKSADILYNS